ncbi:hypothetical protein [Desulfocurvus sp.]|jgi:hypothetical protein|uniref:hypothetical protein n=1 Tax=Desulfocurvus sp. TaxID=2871698 RepID=UPI0025C25E84|nr:hypothetical protein [Desulfocurvus sp.]MCK9239205.1 hypothetical protein [Desulfocurvus sp.]
MPKRQVLLLVVMVLALAYAGYDFLLADKGRDPGALAAERARRLEAVASSVRDVVAKDRLTAIEAYRLTRVAPGQGPDPLVRTRPPAGGGEDVDEILEAGGRFVYSGMVALGASRLAVVNDSEYRTGELVGETGFSLVDIRADAVVLQGRNPQTGALENVIVPIEEDIINFVEEGDAKNQ